MLVEDLFEWGIGDFIKFGQMMVTSQEELATASMSRCSPEEMWRTGDTLDSTDQELFQTLACLGSRVGFFVPASLCSALKGSQKKNRCLNFKLDGTRGWSSPPWQTLRRILWPSI